MKTKVYATPESITVPQITQPFDFNGYQKACRDYVDAVKRWAKEYGKGTEAGKEIRFPVADGYACYVVVSLNPVTLIHLSHSDGYQFPYVERLTADDIRAEIQRAEAFEKIFAKNS